MPIWRKLPQPQQAQVKFTIEGVSIAITPSIVSALASVVSPIVQLSEPTSPVGITQPASNIVPTTATINGKISDDGGANCEGRFRYRENVLLTIQPATKDTYLQSSAPDTNYGSGTGVTIYDYSSNTRRGLLEFLITSIPTGAIIESAKLDLYYASYYNYNPVGKTVWAYRGTRADWVELEATWNSYKTSTAWTTAGGDYTATDGVSVAMPASYGWVEWDITNQVLYAQTNSVPVEVLVKFSAENQTTNRTSLDFYSSDYATASYRPKLIIKYWIPTDWDNNGGSYYRTNATFLSNLTSLVAVTEYEYQVQAKNSAGEGIWSSSAYFTTALTPSFIQAIGSVIAPTVVFGSLSITPSPVQAVASIVAPTVVLGSLSITPSYAQAIASVIEPTALSEARVTPDFVSAIATVSQPTVSIVVTVLSFVETTRQRVTPATTGSWVDIDLSSYIPAEATMAILHVRNSGSAAYQYGLRTKDPAVTDSRYAQLDITTQCWAMVKVGTNRNIQAWIGTGGSSSIDIYITGYTLAGVTGLVNGVSFAPTTGSWQTIDLSSYVPVGTKAAIFEVHNSSATARGYGLRMYGSGDNRAASSRYKNQFTFIVGLDSSRRCEAYRINTSVGFYLLGYINFGVVMNLNATAMTLTADGYYHNLPAIGGNASFGFFEVNATTNVNYALRKKGDVNDYYHNAYFHPFAIVPCDANGLVEGKIASTAVGFYLAGYAILAGLIIIPSPAQAVGSVVAPTVGLTAPTITPTPVSCIAQVAQPNVVQGNILYTPESTSAIARAIDPFIILSGIVPEPVSAIAGIVAPVIILTSMTITPTEITAIAEVNIPNVLVGGELYITPEYIQVLGDTVNPTVVLGSIIVIPNPDSAIGQVIQPNVRQGDLHITPAYGWALGQVIAPTVYAGVILISPDSAQAIARGLSPTVIEGSMTITPTFLRAIAQAISPAVTQGWEGRKLHLVISTSQARRLAISTSQKRKVEVMTGE
ncbi:MAG: DNRLRE domain-containing protein [Dehalococcoidia bacterium]